jgi:hypothetical protein
MKGIMVTAIAMATNAATQSQSPIYRQERVHHLSSGTLRRASQIYERETLGTSFNLAEPLLRLAELEVRIGVHPHLLLLAMLGSGLRSGGQVWIDPSADCQFAAGDTE